MSVAFDKKVIFVGGIHGVGKTTLCRKISKTLSLKHYSASDLILKLKSENIEKDKKVKNIRLNQNILLESITRYLNNEEYYLLDGHFCLLNSNEDVTEIPLDTFKSLGLKAIVVLVDKECEIIKRLANRDSNSYPIKLIEEFQKKEVLYAQKVAKILGVRCEIFKGISDIDEMLIFINSILEEQDNV